MSQLDELRVNINEIDNKIIDLLISRMEVSVKVGEYKKEKGIKVLDSKREKEVIKRIIEVKNKKISSENKVSLDDKFLENLWILIMDYSKAQQSNF